MTPLEVGAVILGTLLFLFILTDVGLTTLHPDANGRLTRFLQRAVWRSVRPLADRFPKWRRPLLALAGPIMMVITFLAWTALFILGFAFVFWPFLPDHFHLAPHQEPADFYDALYFSGNTGTVLGYGDVTPTTPVFEVLAIVESGFGFLLLGGVVTYAFNVLSGIMRRNTIALDVHGRTWGTGDGVQTVARAHDLGIPDDVGHTLENWASVLRELQVEFQRLPVLVFYYRSANPASDPEPMIETMAETILAVELLAPVVRGGGVQLAVDRCREALEAVMATAARQYLPSHTEAALARAEADEESHAFVERVHARLRTALGPEVVRSPGDLPRPTRDFAVRATRFLRVIDEHTHWRRHKTDATGK